MSFGTMYATYVCMLGEIEQTPAVAGMYVCWYAHIAWVRKYGMYVCMYECDGDGAATTKCMRMYVCIVGQPCGWRV